MTHRIDTIDVQGSPMEVFISEPEGAGPHPGIVQCQHIPVGHTGIENDEFTLRTAERFAENGYVVATPFIFHWWPKEAEMQLKRDEFRDDWTTLDLNAAYEDTLDALVAALEYREHTTVGHSGKRPAQHSCDR